MLKSRFRVSLSTRAERQLMRFPKDVRRRLLEALVELESSPLLDNPKVKRLKGFSEPHYELKVSDYRIVYRIEDQDVIVALIVHRKDLLRALREIS